MVCLPAKVGQGSSRHDNSVYTASKMSRVEQFYVIEES